MNVALVPILSVLGMASRSLGWATAMPDLQGLLRAIWFINFVLLIFNILPIYPLDGGQILRSLLWYVMGRARSLMVAAIIGLVGAAGLIVLALWSRSVWYGAISAFMLMNCWTGLKQAQALSRLAKLPRRDGFECPRCKTAPPVGEFWKCVQCGQPFDTFQSQAACPHCAARYTMTSCLDCGGPNPISAWIVPITGAPL